MLTIGDLEGFLRSSAGVFLTVDLTDTFEPEILLALYLPEIPETESYLLRLDFNVVLGVDFLTSGELALLDLTELSICAFLSLSFGVLPVFVFNFSFS